MITQRYFPSLTLNALNEAFNCIEMMNETVVTIFANRHNCSIMQYSWGKTVFDHVTNKVLMETGVIGHVFSAEVRLDKYLPDRSIFLISSNDRDVVEMVFEEFPPVYGIVHMRRKRWH